MTHWILHACCVLLLAGCKPCEHKLKIAATSVPHADILRQISPELKNEGICLKIIEVDDYHLPNRLLFEKQVDANFFQHRPFLERQEKQFGYAFKVLTPVHLEPLGIYASKISHLSDLKCGQKVAIPSDPTNEGRSLLLLEEAGVITLKTNRGDYPTILDIATNPLCLRFEEIDAPYLPKALPDVTCAVIPSNFALQANLLPGKDAIYLEAKDSPYANVVVIRADDDNPDLLTLKKILTSQKIKEYLNSKYQGSILPAFD